MIHCKLFVRPAHPQLLCQNQANRVCNEELQRQLNCSLMIKPSINLTHRTERLIKFKKLPVLRSTLDSVIHSLLLKKVYSMETRLTLYMSIEIRPMP
jgi:hypothetical protein